MKIFSAHQIYDGDEYTIEKQKISSNELMERAAFQIFKWLHEMLQGAPVKIHLFCGIGNNGGDGLVIARHLKEHGYTIEVSVVNYSKKRSEDFLINLERLKERKVWPNFMTQESPLPEIEEDDIVVDAIFGIGLNRDPDPWVVSLIQHISASGAYVLAVDIPSGLFMDKSVNDPNAVLKANFVLSFQAPKLIFFLPETGRYVKQWQVLDIGMDQEYLQSTDVDYELLTKPDVLPWYKPREKFTHKGTYGHALIVGGSYGKIGAVILSAKAALRAGSGLVTAYIPSCGYVPLQTAIPEVMVLTDTDEHVITDISFKIEPTVVGLGIGLGVEVRTIDALSKFLSKNKLPLVVDADGLNILSKNKELLKKLPAKSILTPHPKELERLIGKWKDDFDKLEKAKEFSKKYDCILVIKGAHTITIYENKGYVNTTGNPGMATGGSGDVLTGIITSLLAQGYEPLKAAIFGVYLHGLAGDLAAEQVGYEALIATSITKHIGAAYLDLTRPALQTTSAEASETK